MLWIHDIWRRFFAPELAPRHIYNRQQERKIGFDRNFAGGWMPRKWMG